MRVTLLLSFIALGLVWTSSWNWDHLDAQTSSLDAIPWNARRMTEDLVDLLADHPTLERLYARAYVARALASCYYPCLAIEQEIDDFSRAIDLDPKYARAYVYRGSGLFSHIYRNGRFDEKAQSQSISDMSMAIKLDPKGKPTDAAYEILSSEYELCLHQPQKAIEVCDAAILNLPAEKARHHYTFRAWIHGRMGLHQQETEDYRLAKNLDSQFEWTDRCSLLMWQLRWIGWLLLVLMPLYFWINRRLSPALNL